MNTYERIINILLEATLDEGSMGLKRRARVAKAMARKLQGNQSQVNPDDPNLQEPGANTEAGKQVYTPSERQNANAKAAEFFRRSGDAEAKRGERIRQRIVKGGKELRRMAAGAQKGEKLSPQQKSANREVGGVDRVKPTDVLAQSRANQDSLKQKHQNARHQAQSIRFDAVNAAREKRGMIPKPGYSSNKRNRTPGVLDVDESIANIQERMINILLEARVQDYLDRLDEKTRYQKEIEKGNLSDKSIRRLQSAAKKGKLNPPEEPERGRIAALGRLKKRHEAAKKNKAKGKPYEINLRPADTKPRELPKGPGKQTGPLEKRGLKIKPQKPQKPQRDKK